MCWAIVTFYTLPKVNNSTHLHTCSTWKFVLQLRRILQHISFEKYLAQQLCKCSKIGFSQPDTQNTNWLLWSLFLFFLPNYLEIAGLCNGRIHFTHGLLFFWKISDFGSFSFNTFQQEFSKQSTKTSSNIVQLWQTIEMVILQGCIPIVIVRIKGFGILGKEILGNLRDDRCTCTCTLP